jgi:hypothetical protein
LKIYSEFHKNTTKTLVEDSTTSKAIHWLYPFNNIFG